MGRVRRCGVTSLIGLVLLGAAAGATGQQAASADAAMPQDRVPEHTIIVKGAWPSASDSSTPVPEDGKLADGSYRNDYFGIDLRFSQRWQPGLAGPPPSDSGSYTLAQIVPADGFRAGKPGHLLLTAQDMFFSAASAGSALELVDFTREHLNQSVYRIEQAPREVALARHTFIRFGYVSPSAGLHWSILATQIRCHIVELVLVGSEAGEPAELLKAVETMALPAAAGTRTGAGGGEAPVCIKDYATADNLIEREEPVLSEPRYNAVPVRVIIDRQGMVKHIHFLRAFPDQARAITDALHRWRFRPHTVNGVPVEVETGIVFGRPDVATSPTSARPRHTRNLSGSREGPLQGAASDCERNARTRSRMSG